MRVIRSWPMTPPDEHPRVFDNCERIYIPTTDYRPLVDVGENLIHLDWDVAVGRTELREFARKCEAEPDRCRVAPTWAYVTRMRRDHYARGQRTELMIWKYDQRRGRMRVQWGDPECNLFGFGFVYLPTWAFCGYVADLDPATPASDTGFGQWYFKATNGQGVPVEWGTHAVHTNYSMKDALTGPE